MNLRRLNLLFAFLISFSTACVTNKQATYFQNNDLYQENVKEDSIYRTYKRAAFDYKLQPFDVLSLKFTSLTSEELNIFKREQSETTMQGQGDAVLLAGYMIDKDGNLFFPVVGAVNVAGLTLNQVQDRLTAMASEYLEDPVVEVKILNYRFTILGEVNNEGTHTTFNYAISIPEALGLSGGLTDLGDRDNIKIIRKSGNTTEVLYVNLLQENFFGQENIFIHPNDIIVVPPLKQRPFRNYFSQNLSVFTSSLSVFLVGMNLYFLINSRN